MATKRSKPTTKNETELREDKPVEEKVVKPDAEATEGEALDDDLTDPEDLLVDEDPSDEEEAEDEPEAAPEPEKEPVETA